ncbi:polysaccharide biosynthesis protein [Parablastomonas sp. CN1-191]|uniref:polysaccharide biosynthesis protein n=1 Tax=Parablastomonas sp. CN1-191 TaxID=3400908 RepID=UPI003BF86E0A
MASQTGGRALEAARNAASWLLEKDRPSKRLLMAGTDCIACIAAVWLSFSLRLGFWEFNTAPVRAFAVFQLVTFLIIFNFVGAYRNIFRFHGARGLIQLAWSCALLAIPNVIVFGFIGMAGVPRTLSVLFPILFLALVALVRITARYVLLDVFAPDVERQRVLIYGAGLPGRQLAFSLDIEPTYRMVGYVDDDPALAGTRIENYPIYHAGQLEQVLRDRDIHIVLLAMPELNRSARAEIVKRLQSSGVQVQTLPGVREIVDGRVSIKDLRDIAVSDLLSRDTVAPDPALLARAIKGRTVLVTGAGGSIGSELCRQILRQQPRRLVMFEMTEAVLFAIDGELRQVAAEIGSDVELIPELGSLENEAATKRLFERFQPEVVFHAAAYKHVPLVERNTVAGVRNNVLSTLHAAVAACESGAERFVLVSTDKAVRPTNVMGASKRVCELILQALAGRQDKTTFSMVRFGNVLGSSGSVVPQFERQIAAGGPVTVTHRDVTRFFMTIPEAAELVIQAGAMARGGEVYLLDMGEPVKIHELARAMIRLAGLTVRDEANPDGDVAIEEIGLRPGEKLYEELLISAEARATDHPRIMMADEDCIGWAELERALDDLSRLLDHADAQGVRAMLRRLVPGFADGEGAVPAAHDEDDMPAYPAAVRR